MHRIIFAAAFILHIACLPANAEGLLEQDPRLTLSLFRYDGTDEGEPKRSFSQFKGILVEKVLEMVEEPRNCPVRETSAISMN